MVLSSPSALGSGLYNFYNLKKFLFSPLKMNYKSYKGLTPMLFTLFGDEIIIKPDNDKGG